MQAYVEIAGRKGITPDAARTVLRTDATVIAALMVRGPMPTHSCAGSRGRFMSHLRHIRDIIGYAPGVEEFAALSLVITSKGAYFLADTEGSNRADRG